MAASLYYYSSKSSRSIVWKVALWIYRAWSSIMILVVLGRSSHTSQYTSFPLYAQIGSPSWLWITTTTGLPYAFRNLFTMFAMSGFSPKLPSVVLWMSCIWKSTSGVSPSSAKITVEPQLFTCLPSTVIVTTDESVLMWPQPSSSLYVSSIGWCYTTDSSRLLCWRFRIKRECWLRSFA